MTGLLELREKIKLIYSKNEVFILPVVKFLFALFTLHFINDKMGYMQQLDNMALVLIVALLCSFMPNGCLVFFGAMFSLLHMYALSLEVAVVGLVVYMILFMVFLRFSSKDTLAVVLTPILCSLHVPYVMPVAMGLVGTPFSAVAVSCGVVVYYLIQMVVGIAPTISTMADEEATAKLRLLLDALLDNKAMLVMIAAFAVTVIVVYLIRRMSVDYAWTIAIVAGVIVDLILLLIGDLIYDTNMSVANALLGAVVAVLVAKVIEFFRFCVDYSRTEKVQFEDDEYYYYVKAVPKMTVAAPTKTVKRINAQHGSSVESEKGLAASGKSAVTQTRTTQTKNNSTQRKNTQAEMRTASGKSRIVTTERTASGNGQAGYNYRKDRANTGKSVTINSNQRQDEDMAEFEDLF